MTKTTSISTQKSNFVIIENGEKQVTITTDNQTGRAVVNDGDGNELYNGYDQGKALDEARNGSK